MREEEEARQDTERVSLEEQVDVSMARGGGDATDGKAIYPARRRLTPIGLTSEAGQSLNGLTGTVTVETNE